MDLTNETIEYLRNILALAEQRAEKLGKIFKEEDFKWTLGVNILSDIVAKTEYIKIHSDQPVTLFGVIVEHDYFNPDTIQLWENITNKV